ncbi:TnpV protein [Peptoniphilus asaccharolyticus]
MKIGTDQIGWCLFFCNRHIFLSFVKCNYTKTKEDFSIKSIYENLGGTYKANGDYRLPTLALPKEEQFEIGMWGQRFRRYLKENHRIIYYNYLTKGTLNKHLKEIDTRAEEMFQQLVKSLAEKENVTESLKAKDMML